MTERNRFYKQFEMFLDEKILLEDFADFCFGFLSQCKKFQSKDFELFQTIFEYVYLSGDEISDMPSEIISFLNRCLLFLETDIEYRWHSTKESFYENVVYCLSLGVVDLQKNRLNKQGDFEYWPFLTKKECSEVVFDSYLSNVAIQAPKDKF